MKFFPSLQQKRIKEGSEPWKKDNHPCPQNEIRGEYIFQEQRNLVYSAPLQMYHRKTAPGAKALDLQAIRVTAVTGSSWYTSILLGVNQLLQMLERQIDVRGEMLYRNLQRDYDFECELQSLMEWSFS